LLAIATAVSLDAPRPALFVIDAMGDSRLKLLESVANCVAVVRAQEHERVLRLLATLTDQLSMRRHARASLEADRTAAGAAAPTVLLVDGLTALRDELDSADMHDQLDQLDAIISDGASAGVLVVGTTNRPAALPTRLLTQLARRWVFHLADAIDAPLLGVP